MPTRRQILIQTAGAAALLTLSGAALAAANAVQGATAITRVFGDGMRLVAVAVEYREALSRVDKSAYHVAGRNINNASLSDRIDGAPAASGRYLILELNPDDDGALLTVKKGRPAKQSKNDPAKNEEIGGEPGSEEVPPSKAKTTPRKTAPAKWATKTTARPSSNPLLQKSILAATPSKPGTSPTSSSTTSDNTNMPTPPPAKPCATTCSRRKTPLPARVTRWCSLCTTRA